MKTTLLFLAFGILFCLLTFAYGQTQWATFSGVIHVQGFNFISGSYFLLAMLFLTVAFVRIVRGFSISKEEKPLTLNRYAENQHEGDIAL